MVYPHRVVASLFLSLLAAGAYAGCLAPTFESRTTAVTSAFARLRYSIAVDDFNEDGILDAITIGRGTQDTVLFTPGTAPGSFGSPIPVHSGEPLLNLAAKDVNGDQNLDLVILEGYDGVALLPGLGDGTFAAPVRSAMIIGGNWVLEDFTGDHVSDIAAFTFEESGPKLTLFTGSAAGMFTETRRIPLEENPIPIAAGDLDGDSAIDLVVASSNGSSRSLISFVFGNGDGTFDPIVTQPVETLLATATLADVDGDGDLDALMTAQNSLVIYRNLGARSFASPERYPIVSPDTISNGQYDFAAADFTGDGIRDVIATALSGGYIATLRGKGDGTFHAASFEPLFLGQFVNRIGAVADLDGDQRLDVITAVSAYSSAVVATLLNRCGDTGVFVFSNTLVSVGTEVTYHINVAAKPLAATGSVSLFRGDTLAGTASLVDGVAIITAPAPPAGEHSFLARYAGDEQYEPAQSAPFIQSALQVTPNQPVAIDARGLTYAIQIGYVLPEDTQSIAMFRRAAGTVAWDRAVSWSPATGLDTGSMPRGVMYEYYLEAQLTDNTIVESNVDRAMLFTDDPLASGSLLKTAHFLELQQAVNEMRAKAGLSPFVFDSSVNAGTLVRASHLERLRAAANQARSALGWSTATFPLLTAGTTPILASDVQQLRDLSR